MLVHVASGSLRAADSVETKHVDLKQEAGLWSREGRLPSGPHNEVAAKALAAEAACMSNTDGGGALVVGVDDDDHPLGTALDAEWLRRRIYDLSQRHLTVEATEHNLDGNRLLVLRCPEAVEPVRMDGRIRWRVGDACVEVDAATWHEHRLRRIGYDWSAQPSAVPVGSARAGALETARGFLRASREEHSLDLADAPNLDLLTRLDVVTADGMLTNAGVVAFVGREAPGLDYVRREAAGGDSLNRVRRGGRGLVEELSEVEQAIRLANPVRHVPDGLVAGQVRELPAGAVRETIVNGCVHRDWYTVEPTLIEHEGGTPVVTSPGGFIGGVTAQNIMTHPSQPRNRSLAELFAALRVAEREGVGVDRMVREMVRLGHSQPDIQEIAGPHVRTALVGEIVDQGWMAFLAQVTPDRVRNDLNSLLLLRHLVDHLWVDAARGAPLLQRTPLEAAAALSVLANARVNGAALMAEVAGVPDDASPAWRLTVKAVEALAGADRQTEQRRRPVTRTQVAREWALARGRVSTTELASIVGATPSNMGSVLKALEQEGLLAPSSEARRGRGFYYRLARGSDAGDICSSRAADSGLWSSSTESRGTRSRFAAAVRHLLRRQPDAAPPSTHPTRVGRQSSRRAAPSPTRGPGWATRRLSCYRIGAWNRHGPGDRSGVASGERCWCACPSRWPRNSRRRRTAPTGPRQRRRAS